MKAKGKIIGNRKVIAAILSIVMCGAFAFVPESASASDTPVLKPDVSKPTSGNVFVGVAGSYESYSKADVLKRINAIRKEAYNEGLVDYYAPLKWSKSLESIAQIRAVEASVLLSHVRPKGGYVFDMAVGGVNSYGEDLAWGVGTMDAIELWYSEKKNLTSNNGQETGHYENLIDPWFTHIALGSFRPEDTWNCVSAELTSAEGVSEDRTGIKGKCIQMIEAPTKKVSMYISGKSTLYIGNSRTYKAYAKYNGFDKLRLQNVTWSSSVSSKAPVSKKGKVKALKKGAPTIKAKCGSLTAKKKLTLKVKGTTIKSLKPAKKAFTVTVNKRAKANVSGYQVRYSTKSSMKNAKKVKISYSKASKKIKKLKKKTKYYVQVRTYKTVKGKKYYSSWSKTKKVKTK